MTGLSSSAGVALAAAVPAPAGAASVLSSASVGFAAARYLVKRLHARLPSVPILVALWDEGETTKKASQKFLEAGARKVVHTLAEARELLTSSSPSMEAQPVATATG